MEHHCQCPCGTNQFVVLGRPVMRMFCHCTICQAFNQSAYSDVTVFFSADVKLPENHQVEFQAYRPPPAVQRGKCRACNLAAVEFFRIPPFVELVIVPSANFGADAIVPAPSMHMFYNSRVADVDDDLPKHSGYLRSQWAFTRQLIASTLHSRKSA